MDLFMPAERVLYDRAYYLSDEAEKDYASEVAEEHGIDVGEVLSSDELMDEVHDALERHIDIDLDDEIGNFDSMLRELKRGDDPEHPAEISVVAKGTVERWDKPSRGLVIADSLLSLVSGTGSADALKDFYQVAASPDRPYTVKISTGGGACGDAGLQFASVGEAKEWCYRYSLREVAEGEKRPEPAAAAATAKRAAWRTGGDGAGDAGAIKL